MLKYDSVAELVNEAEKRGLKLSELVLKSQAQIAERTEAEMFAQMARSLEVMKESVQEGMDRDKRSASGLTGGDAFKMNEALMG
ncbi:MAG: L-serine ammonia-lyase, iron-sulfur-dependent, subunit alpha, partial [Anaerotignum sp.]|nr:L-serine ammonia-lyase, iron-sulfur-dependent, subunit alpha [Anaerotignum sp.]